MMMSTNHPSRPVTVSGPHLQSCCPLLTISELSSIDSSGDANRSRIIPNCNPVSTRLRLSYDDDEHKSSVTSSDSIRATPSIMLPIGDNIRVELDR
ncbi:unnamed protein product [Lupinus luteus]|uniref:Uncharacterized protein n=1 Tax=Lupinus luteus TaxID=3873 RepID=A0AAV1YFM0_LUPLU